jgi:Pro-kumamolisin, activation domain
MIGRTATLAALALLAVAPPARGEVLRRLPDSRARGLARLEPLGRAPDDLRLDGVTVVFGLRRRRVLDAIIAAQADPRSPRFGQRLGADEIADGFGARRTEYERVRRWFVEHGFEVTRESPFRLTLVVSGTAAQVEAALATPIGLFRRYGRVHHGPLAEPALPESVSSAVRGILGLDDLPKFRPLVQLANGTTALAPSDFAAAYDVASLQAVGLTGGGHSIAVIARSNFLDSDIAAFSSHFLPRPLSPVRVFTGADPGILPDEGEQIEVLLDTQWAGSLAPGAALNVMIGSKKGNIPEALETAIDNRARGMPSGDVISVSFGLCEPLAEPVATEFFDYLYAVANAQGQTVLVAAGDDGAQDCLPDRPDIAVNGLASSPHAIAVGGTSFALDPTGAVPVPLVETPWNDGFGAGGGGRSVFLAMPPYQLAAGLAPFGAGRVLPDLALAASPRFPGYVIVQDGVERIVGGTSAGVPAFAGVVALLNERLATSRGRTGGLGQLTPEIHHAGNEQVRGLRAPVFRDVTTGSNGFVAGPGFDLATGWGAPLAGALADALDGPQRCEPLIDTVHPEAGCLVPSGRGRNGCAGEWLVEQGTFGLRGGLPAVGQSCRDGDPQCDADGIADGRCTFRVALCANVFDFRLLKSHPARRSFPFRCRPGTTRRMRLVSPRARGADETDAAARAALFGAFASLPLPTSLADACTTTVPVNVPVGDRLRLRALMSGSLGARKARLTLHCTS